MNKEYIKDVPVSKLKPYERNPRKNKHAVDALAKSIQRVGNNDPIEVNEDYVILCGHTRKQALEKLNIKTTDIVMIKGLTEEQQNEYRITNNKTGEIAEWDFEVLEEDFSPEELEVMGFENTNFEPGTLEEQGKLDELKPRYVICPDCGKEFCLKLSKPYPKKCVEGVESDTSGVHLEEGGAVPTSTLMESI